MTQLELIALAMAYVAASDGLYRGMLTYQLDLTPGKVHMALAEADAGGIHGEWNCRVLVKERPCD